MSDTERLTTDATLMDGSACDRSTSRKSSRTRMASTSCATTCASEAPWQTPAERGLTGARDRQAHRREPRGRCPRDGARTAEAWQRRPRPLTADGRAQRHSDAQPSPHL